MMVNLSIHICITQPKCVNPNNAASRHIPGELGPYNGYWCPGFLHHQVISSHSNDYIRYIRSCLLRKDFNNRHQFNIKWWCQIQIHICMYFAHSGLNYTNILMTSLANNVSHHAMIRVTLMWLISILHDFMTHVWHGIWVEAETHDSVPHLLCIFTGCGGVPVHQGYVRISNRCHIQKYFLQNKGVFILHASCGDMYSM